MAVVLCVNTWHHLENRGAWLDGMKAFFRPGAPVVFVDFTLEAEEGPPWAIRLSSKTVHEEFEKAGFALASTLDFLPKPYGLVFVLQP